VLVRDPQALLSTDLTLLARQIVTYFIRRWSMETTVQEARLYPAMQGQRQWNDVVAACATPVRVRPLLLSGVNRPTPAGLAGHLSSGCPVPKARPTFADALAQVRRVLWRQLGFWLFEAVMEKQKPTPVLIEHFTELLA
jgi:hypothetical protein